MTTYEVFSKELFALQNEKGNICVSIIVPVLSKSADRRIETLNIKHAFQKAALLLKNKYQTPPVKMISKIY